jgi:hypothetical protein
LLVVGLLKPRGIWVYFWIGDVLVLEKDSVADPRCSCPVNIDSKQRWCSIEVPRLNPGSDCVSHDRQLSGLTCVWIAQPIGAKVFLM